MSDCAVGRRLKFDRSEIGDKVYINRIGKRKRDSTVGNTLPSVEKGQNEEKRSSLKRMNE